MIKEKIIAKIPLGSHLYGLNTEKSDKDFLIVYLPFKKDLITSDITSKYKDEYNFVENKNDIKSNSNTIETKCISIHKFLHLCIKGNLMCLEALSINPYLLCGMKYKNNKWIHTNESLKNKKEKIYFFTKEWEFLFNNRKKFFTKNIYQFIRYAKSQKYLYSFKESKLELIQKLIKDIENINDSKTLDEYLNIFQGKTIEEKINNFILKYTSTIKNIKNHIKYNSNWEQFENNKVLIINDKIFPLTLNLKEVKNRLKLMQNKYGQRVKSIKENGGDFKSLSHSMRLLLEIKEILINGSLKLPFTGNLKQFLLNIKTGYFNIEEVLEKINILSKEIEESIIINSKLPEKISEKNINFFKNWIYKLYEEM